MEKTLWYIFNATLMCSLFWAIVRVCYWKGRFFKETRRVDEAFKQGLRRGFKDANNVINHGAELPGWAKDSGGHTLTSINRLILQIALPSPLRLETMAEGGRMFLRVACKDGTCNRTGEKMSWNGRWWRLSPHMTDSEVVGTAFKAYLTALEHEARETFTFQGEPIYDAHLSVYQLANLSRDRSSRDVRPDPEA